MKVLVVRYSAIGDCVMTAWAVTSLRRRFPEAEIVWAVQERAAPVIDSHRLVNQVVLADRDAWRKRRGSPQVWRDQLRVFLGLRRNRFDLGFDFQGHSKTALCLRIAKPTKRWASRATDALAARLNPTLELGAGERHEVDVAMDLIRYAVPDVPDPTEVWMPTVAPNPQFDVTIQTGAGHPAKIVPTATWREVADQLVSSGLSVALIGAPNDPAFEAFGVMNLVGKYPLVETLGAVVGSGVHVAGDTGTGHIAAAYGIPTVSVFGPTEPSVYAPRGPRTQVLRRGISPEGVSADEIVAAIHQLREAQL